MEYYVEVVLPNGKNFRTEHHDCAQSAFAEMKNIEEFIPTAQFTFWQKYTPGDYRDYNEREFIRRFMEPS
jgi:hypothetical protein